MSSIIFRSFFKKTTNPEKILITESPKAFLITNFVLNRGQSSYRSVYSIQDDELTIWVVMIGYKLASPRFPQRTEKRN